MVQEYKNSDLDLFQKINIQDPKDNFVNKKKKIKSSNSDKKLGFNYALQDVNNFKNIENTLTNDKSKKNESVFFNQIDVDDYSGFKDMYPHNISLGQATKKKIICKKTP